MRKAMPAATPVFTPGERDYIRRELDHFFSTLPRVADGVQLRTWRGGPQAGQPKVPAAAPRACSNAASCACSRRPGRPCVFR